jgi:hypothetical protein
MMSVSAIREAINAQPFRPFTVRVADQRSYLVPHPEFISIGPNNRTAVVWFNDGGCSILDMLLITGIDISPPAENRPLSP